MPGLPTTHGYAATLTNLQIVRAARTPGIGCERVGNHVTRKYGRSAIVSLDARVRCLGGRGRDCFTSCCRADEPNPGDGFLSRRS